MTGAVGMPTILLVEDDAAHAELIGRALEDSKVDHKLHHVSDGDEALAYLEGLPDVGAPDPRVILLDFRLPRISGLGVLQRIRANQRLRMLPVVMLSSSGATRDVQTAYEQGANGYLVKPIDFGELRQRLAVFASYWLQHNQT
jgi:two-component system, response regulator